jgi:carbamoyltransferase
MSTTATGLAVDATQAFVGVHDGHNASVAVVAEGKLLYALQEERLTRVKNQGDAPELSLRQALALAPGSRTPRIALNGNYVNYGQWDRESVIRDYEASAGLTSRLKQPLKGSVVDRAYQKRKVAERMERMHGLGLVDEQMVAIEHHRAHASAAYYTAPWRAQAGSFPEKTLVLTCDGSGDRLSATVSIGEGSALTRIAQVEEHDSIGRLYALITRYLGMVPLEHEYKVMGLAPYASAARGSAEVEQLFCDLFEFPGEGMVWRRKRGVPSMYSAYEFLTNFVKGYRFDYVAAGAQAFIERMLTRWVRNAVRETGIGRLACGGGVFMNVKANLAILELPEVEDMYVMPSCGDESNSIGAACWEAARAGEAVAPLTGLYFGDAITDAGAEEALVAAARAQRSGVGKLKFRWCQDVERVTAEHLASGHIVARAKGANEFGARALGNRSILARPDAPDVVKTINEAIKSRDFWMPFAPSVLAERSDRYYTKPKPISSPYMMFAFRARPEMASAFAAAQHPYDLTARAHEVDAVRNADYHRLLSEYESITGEAIVLNTSFNLHGDPIVYTAADAIDVLERSGLRYLALGNWWVEKAA